MRAILNLYCWFRYDMAILVIYLAVHVLMQGQTRELWAKWIKSVADGVQRAQNTGQKRVRFTARL